MPFILVFYLCIYAGHTDVSPHIHKNTHYELGLFVERQRRHFENRKQRGAKGAPPSKRGGTMTDEEMEKLASIGAFVCSLIREICAVSLKDLLSFLLHVVICGMIFGGVAN